MCIHNAMLPPKIAMDLDIAKFRCWCRERRAIILKQYPQGPVRSANIKMAREKVNKYRDAYKRRHGLSSRP